MSPSPHPLLPAAVQETYRREGLWSDRSVLQLLVDRADRDADAPLYLGDSPITYGEAAQRARALAGYLSERGVGMGDTVVAPLVSGWEAAVVLAAASGLGAQLAPLPSRVSRTQLLALVEATRARIVVISGRLLAKDGWQETMALLVGETSVEEVLLADVAHAPSWTLDLRTVESIALSHPLIEVGDIDLGAPFLLLSTGGTTGPSKVVVHSGQAAIYAASQYVKHCGLRADDRVLAAGPFGHASGTVFTLIGPLLAGAAVLPVIRWDAAAVSDAVRDHGVTWALLSGTHIYDLLHLDEDAVTRWSSVRGMSAGSGSDERYAAAEVRLDLRIRRMYGLTECMGHAVMPADAPDDVRMSRDGLPFDGIECYIDGGAETGEYLVRGPSLMLGYLDRADLTRESVTADGFLRTGDVMSIDHGGYVRYVGRLKDVIRRGGVNIDPLELERLLVQHPDVNDVSVIGMPDARLGERAVAVVVPRTGRMPSLDDLTALLTARDVPRSSHPEGIITVADLPKTEYGKHDKAALRKQLATDRIGVGS